MGHLTMSGDMLDDHGGGGRTVVALRVGRGQGPPNVSNAWHFRWTIPHPQCRPFEPLLAIMVCGLLHSPWPIMSVLVEEGAQRAWVARQFPRERASKVRGTHGFHAMILESYLYCVASQSCELHTSHGPSYMFTPCKP